MGGVRTLGELARLVGGELRGDPGIPISGVESLERAGPGQLSFVAARRHLATARESRAAAFLVPADADLPGRPVIRVAEPYLAVATLLELFHPAPAPAPGLHPTALVDPTARVAPEASVGAFAVVGARSVLEAGAVLHPHVVVGPGCRVGARSVLHPHVVLREGVEVGRGVVIHAGTIIGADGFGYAFDGRRHRKIPQVGRVVIEDDVEIGANVTIDRATLGETRIGRGTKIDNLVQIGHNTRVGADAIIVAQTGIAGSCRIGDRVLIGGQAGLTDHLTVGDDARIGSKSGVHRDVPPGGEVLGYPAMPAPQARRAMAAYALLPELVRTVRALERRVAELERRLGAGGG